MVRTRRMAAMSGDDNNGEQSSNATPNDTQPTAIAEKPAKKKRSPVKPRGRKAAQQAARPAVKEEEQAEADVQAEPQPGAQADVLAETGTSNTSIAPEDEGQNVGTSDQPSANTNTATTRPSAKSSTTSERAQPKSTKSKAKPKSKTPAVVEPPDVDEPEAEYDSDIPYIPKDLRKELRERLSRAGLTYPETWRPRVDSPFDAPPPPPEIPPPADSILVAGLADGEVGYLRQLLRYWTSEDKGSRTVHKFFHRLDYTYKKTDSLPEALARHDRVLALTLKRLARAIPFELFFCRLDRGYEDTDIDPQQVSPSYVIEDLVDLRGRSYAKFVPVDETDWTQKTTHHRQPKLLPGYCDVALVLVPRDNVADFLWETIEANGPPTAKYSVTQTPICTLLENYRTLCLGSAEDHVRYWPIFSNLLRRACTWDKEKGLGFMPGTFVESLLKTCISAKDWDLFTFAAGFTGFAFRKLHYDPRPFFKWARSEITEGRATFQDIQDGILAMSFSHSLIKYRCFSITAFYETTDETVPRDWAQNAVVRIADFSDSQIIGPQDGSELVSVMKTYFGLGPDFTELATKLVKRNLTKISFLLGFANKLHESVTSTEDATRKLYLDVAEHILNGLYIYKLHSRSAETVRAREINQLRSDKVTQDLKLLKPMFEGVEKADLARFISGLIAQNADTLLMRLTMKLVGDAKRIPLRELTHLWIPFLWLLLDVLEKHQIPLSTPRYQNIFASIMEVYLFREVGKAPKQIWQPVMRRVSCDCGLCFRVNQFLSESCSFNAVRIHGSSTAFDHVRHYLTGLREAISCDFTIDAASGTITVTKRLNPNPTALKQWETKKNKMKNQIFAKFDQAKLRAILGEEYLWFTGFQLLENILETEVHDEKELPPPPVPSAPILGKPMDHFIIGRPDLFTPSSQGYHQPFHQSTVSGYQGPQPGQAHPQPVGTYYSYQLPPPNQGHRTPANPWAYSDHTSQPVQHGQQFQSWPPQSTQSGNSVTAGSAGFAGSTQMTNKVNSHQTTTHIQDTLEHGRQLFFIEEATVIQRQFPSWQSGAINAELWRRWTTMVSSRQESYANRATVAQNQAQTQSHPALPAPYHSAPRPSGSSLSMEDDLKAGREYYFSTQMGPLRAKHPTYSHQLLLDTILQAWSTLPRTHREWFNKQALSQKQQQPQLAPLDTARAVGPSGTQSIPSLSSIAPPPPPGALPSVLNDQAQPFPSLQSRVAALREEAKVTPTTAFAVVKPVVDKNGMVVVRTSTRLSIPEKDYMESKARLAPYPDIAHLDPCRKELDRGRTWWINKYKDDLGRLLPGKSEQQIRQQLGVEWETCLTIGDRLRTDDMARIAEAKSGRARERTSLDEIMLQRATKRARTTYGASTSATAAGSAQTGPASASATPPPVSGYDVFAKELEGRLRKKNPSASEASLKSVIQRRWEAMSESHRGVYVTMALDEAKSGSGIMAPSTSASAMSASTSTASTSRKYDGFEYYLNTEGLSVRRKHPEYSYNQVVEATKRQWDALKSTERSNYSNKAFAAAQHPLDKGIFTWLEDTFKRVTKGKATVSSIPAAQNDNSSSSSSSGTPQDAGFEFWLKFEERKFRDKNPRLTHAEAVTALRKTWDGMTQMARGIFKDMAAKSKVNADMTAKPTASQAPPSSSSAAAASTIGDYDKHGSPSEFGRYDGFTWFLNSEGVDYKKQNPSITYGDLRAVMNARWCGMDGIERSQYEKVAGTLKKSAEGREMFNRLREACGLPPWQDPRGQLATARCRSPSDAGRYDGFTWFLNTAGVNLKKQNPNIGYDKHRTEIYSQWAGLKPTQRREYENVAITLKQTAQGRALFNRLREAFDLPPEGDPRSWAPSPTPNTATATTATATATAAASSSTRSSNATSAMTREDWERRYDGWSFYLNTAGTVYCNRRTSYDSVVSKMTARWKSMSAVERLAYEDGAKAVRMSGGRQMTFNSLRRACGLPEEPIPPPPDYDASRVPTSLSTTATATTASSSAPSSNASGSITWEAWAHKYGGFHWFLNTWGHAFKQENRELDYDLVVTITESRWERMTHEERRDFEDRAKRMRVNRAGRRMFNKLRELCGLPEEPDISEPAKTVTPRTPFPSTWRGSGSTTATPLLSSSPTRPDPASFSPADRALMEIEPNRMAAPSSSAAPATPGLSDKVAKIDITSAWAVKSSRLKIPPLSTPRSGSGSASASGSGSRSAPRGVKRKAEADVIDLTLDD